MPIFNGPAFGTMVHIWPAFEHRDSPQGGTPESIPARPSPFQALGCTHAPKNSSPATENPRSLRPPLLFRPAAKCELLGRQELPRKRLRIQ